MFGFSFTSHWPYLSWPTHNLSETYYASETLLCVKMMTEKGPLGGGGGSEYPVYPFNLFLEISHIPLIVQALSRKLRVEYPRISFSNIPYR